MQDSRDKINNQKSLTDTDQKGSSSIIDSTLEKEMKHSYIEYAMNVITARAIPNIRDGIKHVQRRILYGLYKANCTSDKPMSKSSKISGEILSKYHPHSDVQIYDSMVRMVQPFNSNHNLLDGQGNFGSIDGDPAAAMRYTALRMSKLGNYMVEDIDKNSVPFRPNYDDTGQEPEVLPSRIPMLLVNGCSGIAVGFATNYPPHNLSSVLDAVIAMVRNESISPEELISIIGYPDFPTGGILHVSDSTDDIYLSGKGQATLRAKTHIDENGVIHVTELPYQVNKSDLVLHIAQLVNNHTIKNITDVSDDSSGKKIHIIIKTSKYSNPRVVLNQLYNATKLQVPVYSNCVALDNKNPKLFSLKQALKVFIEHRMSVIYNRSECMLKKTYVKMQNLLSVLVATSSVKEVVDIIKNAASSEEAKLSLCKKTFILNPDIATLARTVVDLLPQKPFELEDKNFRYTRESINSVLEIRLSALTNLEQSTLQKSLTQQIQQAVHYRDMMLSEDNRKQTIIEESEEIKLKHGRARLTEISRSNTDLKEKDFILPEDIFVTLSRSGYIKSQKLNAYTIQRRGGTGKSFVSSATTTRDALAKTLICNRVDTIQLFSNFGKVYWLQAYHIPFVEKQRGKPISGLVPLQQGEYVTSILKVSSDLDKHIVFITKLGLIKRTKLSLYSKSRPSGLIYIRLREQDEVVEVKVIEQDAELILFTSRGRAARLDAKQVRNVGRVAVGVIGIKLEPKDYVINCVDLKEGDKSSICLVTSDGKARLSSVSLYPKNNRGCKGVKLIKKQVKNVYIVQALLIEENKRPDLLISTLNGLINRIPTKSIPSYKSKSTRGVNAINLQAKDSIVQVDLIYDDINVSSEN